MKDDFRQQPQNIEAEQAVLSSCLRIPVIANSASEGSRTAVRTMANR